MDKKGPCFDFFLFPEKDDFLRNFLQCAIDILKKKYGAHRIQEDWGIQRAFELLQSIPDNEARRFALLFLIFWEVDIAKTLESGIDKEERVYSVMHFQKYRMRLGTFIEQTIHFPYNKHNVIEIVTEFEKAARLEYIMGPF